VAKCTRNICILLYFTALYIYIGRCPVHTYTLLYVYARVFPTQCKLYPIIVIVYSATIYHVPTYVCVHIIWSSSTSILRVQCQGQRFLKRFIVIITRRTHALYIGTIYYMMCNRTKQWISDDGIYIHVNSSTRCRPSPLGKSSNSSLILVFYYYYYYY